MSGVCTPQYPSFAWLFALVLPQRTLRHLRGHDETRLKLPADDESGWALARIQNKRPGRALAGDGAKQTETVLQSAIRLHF